MTSAAFLVSLLAIWVAGADEYATEIVRTPAAKNLLRSCQKPVLRVVFQTFEVKSGTTYVRCPLSNALTNYIGSSMIKLGADPNLPSCSEEAARTGHNTLMISQGECLVSNISTLGYCSQGSQQVVYSAASLLSSDPGIPVSELSNMNVNVLVEPPKLKLRVSFDEGSLHPGLYNYKLHFDGQTADVNNGSDILVTLSTCLDVLFTLTPYFQDREAGDSVVYQLPRSEVPPPEVDLQAITYTSEIKNITINWENFFKTDPCLTMLGYEIELSKSHRGDASKTLEFASDETRVVLSCEETGDYASLRLSIRTVAGVRTPESFEGAVDPSSRLKKYFDKLLQTCVFMYGSIEATSREIICTSNGGQPFDRLKILQAETIAYTTYIPLKYNYSASTWQWEDGTVLSSTDPLWREGAGGPPCASCEAVFAFTEREISMSGPTGSSAICFI